MPICQMKTNYAMDDKMRTCFLHEMAETLSEILEKPIPAVMVMLSEEHMYMNRSADTVFFAEFRYVKNFSNEQEKAAFLADFSDRMLTLIQAYTHVDPYRIYMQFTEMPRDGAWKYVPKT
ncbi:MAG: phenylpyruvate tautomerase MIF-related protein [Oscillospiraceae bacterium]|nr:phenylpyruvate tautomerase MIF-related protein [Oscillospiraceae bacterium]